MKRKALLTLMALALSLTSLFALSACIKSEDVDIKMTSTFGLTPDDEEIDRLDAGKTSLKDYLELIARESPDDEKIEISFSDTSDPESVYLVDLFGNTADSSKGEAWQIYSSSSVNVDNSKPDYEYDGEKYKPISSGIGVLPVEKGVTYIFVLEQIIKSN